MPKDPNGDYEEVCFFAATAKGRDGEGAFAVQGGGPNIPVWANYLGGNSIEIFGWIFCLKNGLRFHFDTVTCLNYPFFNLLYRVVRPIGREVFKMRI